MILAAGILVFGVSSLALIARELRKAPEGYEDEHGFRIVSRGTAGSGVSRSVTTKTRGTRSSRHRAMRHVLAH
jgi:hypothetical protein